MEGGPPIFSPGFTRPNLLYGLPDSRLQGFHLLRRAIPSASLADRFVRFRSPLLTESLLLSFPPPTEMFQFSGFASFTYAFSKRYPCGWVAPFGDLRIDTWLPVPLSFSQAPASFIASLRQDIRHVPLLSVTSTKRRDHLSVDPAPADDSPWRLLKDCRQAPHFNLAPARLSPCLRSVSLRGE